MREREKGGGDRLTETETDRQTARQRQKWQRHADTLSAMKKYSRYESSMPLPTDPETSSSRFLMHDGNLAVLYELPRSNIHLLIYAYG